MVPHLAAAYLYCQLGLGNLPDGVSTWIEENTKLASCNNHDNRALVTEDFRDPAFGENDDRSSSSPTYLQRLTSERILLDSACEKERQQAKPRMSTKKDSASMANKWRLQTSEEFSISIWNACEDSGIMAELDYSF